MLSLLTFVVQTVLQARSWHCGKKATKAAQSQRNAVIAHCVASAGTPSKANHLQCDLDNAKRMQLASDVNDSESEWLKRQMKHDKASATEAGVRRLAQLWVVRFVLVVEGWTISLDRPGRGPRSGMDSRSRGVNTSTLMNETSPRTSGGLFFGRAASYFGR